MTLLWFDIIATLIYAASIVVLSTAKILAAYI